MPNYPSVYNTDFPILINLKNKNNGNILEAEPRVSEHLGPREFEATLGITE